MTLRPHSLILLLLPLCAPAQETRPERSTSLSFGAYEQVLTDGYGPWKGLMLEATFDPGKGGPWLASVVSYNRPEGNGVVLSGGKYLDFPGGFAYLGVATSSGADYLMRSQVSGDLNFALGQSGWLLGGGFVKTDVRDGHRNLLLQAGPTLYAAGCVFTYRFLQNTSEPGSQRSNSQTFEARHGLSDRKPWQSLTLGWGAEAYQNLQVWQAVGVKGKWLGLNAFFPLPRRNGLRVGLEWGQKDGLYRYWGGNLRWVYQF